MEGDMENKDKTYETDTVTASNVPQKQEPLVTTALLASAETTSTLCVAGTDPKEETRPTWSSPMEYYCATLGFLVGYGTIWRFPYLMLKYGGSVFLIGYFVGLVVFGYPMFLLESYIGQFTSNGVFTCWEMFPLLKGIGIVIFLLSLLISLYHASLTSWALYYFGMSLRRGDLPWAHCGNDWNTKNCTEPLERLQLSGPPHFKHYKVVTNLTNILNQNATNVTSGSNLTGIVATIIEDTDHPGVNTDDLLQNIYKDPAEEYWESIVLQFSGSLEYMGYPRWQIAVPLLGAWIIVAFVLTFGPKFYGKIAYTFLLIFPLMGILLAGFLTLPGSIDGVIQLLTPDFNVLTDINFWHVSFREVLITLGIGYGPLITLASYSRFRNDCIRDTFLIPLIQLGVSVAISITIVSFVGHIAHQGNIPLEKLITGDFHLIFVNIASGLTMLSCSALWSSIFYLFIIIIGISSMLAVVETIVTAVLDLCPILHRFRWVVVPIISILCFGIGLLVTTNQGIYIFIWGMWYIHKNFYFVAFIEIFCITSMYGLLTYIFTQASLLRYKDDLSLMLGGKGCHFIPWVACWPIWSFMWFIICPLVLCFIWYIQTGLVYPGKPDSTGNTDINFFIQNNYHWYKYGEHPNWAELAGQIYMARIAVFILIITPIILFLIRICKKDNCSQAMEYLIKPTKFWGPALPKYRERMARYLPDHKYVVNPWNDSINSDEKKPEEV